MSVASVSEEALRNRIAELEERLREADDTLQAIRSGEVDAIVVGGESGQQVYTLQNADRPYRVLIEQMHEGAVTLDLKGTVLYCNERFAQMVLSAREIITGHSIEVFLKPADSVSLASLLANANESGARAEFTLVAANKEIPVNMSLVALPGEEGSQPVICAVVTDLTYNRLRNHELAEANARLEHSEAQLRAIFETSYQFQGLASLDGVLLDANTTSLTAIGCKRKDVVGMKLWDTPWFTGTPGLSEIIRDAFSSAVLGNVVRKEICANLPVGGMRWFDFALRPTYDTQGRILAIVPEASEITERLHAEEALRQSQKLEAMGQLTGGVAHDFNNLLTPIIGGLDMLIRRGVGSDRERKLIEGAAQSADRAKTLVQRLLAFARRQPLQPTAVDIGALVAGMGDLVSSTTGPQIAVKVHVDKDLPHANADANQLEMAILNLSVNARDAMPDGGELRISAVGDTITVGHRTNLTPGNYVRLSVEDTGIGMDEKTASRSIEPFFSTKGIGKGTGLGLSMAHGLAMQLGGALAIDSKIGKGTSVLIWLPVKQASATQSDPHLTMAAAAKQRGTALLVDDEELVRASTADMLSEIGFTVIEAASAVQALAAIEQGTTVDLLITDHLMPGMTGVELARAVRQRFPKMPVLVISGFAERKGIPSDLPGLAKPFRQVELANMIASLI